MKAPWLTVARCGDRDALIVAAMPAPGAYTSGERVLVASLHRDSKDGETPEKWRAHLWPVAGGSMHVARTCEAMDDSSPERLLGKLRTRVAKDGPWWGEAA